MFNAFSDDSDQDRDGNLYRRLDLYPFGRGVQDGSGRRLFLALRFAPDERSGPFDKLPL